MPTIAIVNEKGGTGKTTTSVNLSAALGKLGRKVLLVDLDGQAASSRWLGVEEDTRFAEALWRGDGLEPIPEVVPGVWLAPGSGKLDSVAHDLRPTQGGQLRKLLSAQNGFDYILIDCPPSLGNRLIGNALLAASHAIVPVETSILALDGLNILLTTLSDVRDGFDHQIELLGVLACRFDARTRLSRLILAELNRALPGKVFRTVIRENVRVRECPGSGSSIFDFAPNSHAAEDYFALAHEITESQARTDPSEVSVEGPQMDGLTGGERQVVSEIRQKVDTMVRRFGQEFAVPAEPAGPPETEPAEQSPEAPPVEIAADRTLTVVEMPAQAATPAPAGETETDAIAAGDEEHTVSMEGESPLSAETPASPVEQQQPSWDTPADALDDGEPLEVIHHQQQSSPTQEPPVAPKEMGSALFDSTAEMVKPAQDSQPHDLEQEGAPQDFEQEGAPPDVETPVEPHRDEAMALAPPPFAEKEPEDEAAPPASEGGPAEQYPALRAMLERINREGSQDDEGGGQPDQPEGDDEDKHHGWRRILDKAIGTK